MLKIIESKKQDDYKQTIASFLDLLKVYQQFTFSPEEHAQSVFMIAKDDTLGVYGGALLYKQDIGQLNQKIGKVISTFRPDKQEVWSAKVCLCLDEDESFSSLRMLELMQSFYYALYKAFLKFGEKEKEVFLVLTLQPSDYFKIRTYGFWPYLVEIRPTESLDGLFYGLVSLNSEQVPLEQLIPANRRLP